MPIKESTTVNTEDAARIDIAVMECHDHWHTPIRINGELTVGPPFSSYERAKACYDEMRKALLACGGLEVKSAEEFASSLQN